MPRRLSFAVFVCFGVLLFVGARQTLTDLERATQAKSLVLGISEADAAVASEKQATVSQLDALIAAINNTQPQDVNCAGTWSAWSAVGSCTNGQQHEQRTFTVTTQPSGNGLACPPSPETRTVACSVPPPPVPGTEGPYDFYTQVGAESDIVFKHDLRDNAFLVANKHGSNPAEVTYLPASDSDPRKQDAAKIVMCATCTSLKSQLRISIPAHHPQNRYLSYDIFWTDDFLYSKTAIDRFKGVLQIAGPKDAMHWPIHAYFKLANEKPWNFPQHSQYGPFVNTPFVNPAMGMLSLYDYGTTRGGVNSRLPYNVPDTSANRRNYGGEALGPRDTSVISGGAEFGVRPNVWTRYTAFFERDPAHDKPSYTPPLHAYKFSLWLSDEDRPAVRLYDQLVIYKPQNSAGGWVQLWLEMNASAQPWMIDKINAGRGPLVAYTRSWLVGNGTTQAQVLARVQRKPVR